jgi:DNA-binding SARP family transcriptional activator
MVRIRLLGSLGFDGELSRPLKIERRERELLGLLLTRWPRGLSRTRAIDLLWPDQPEASGQHCLSTALWRLRQALQPVTGMVLDAPRNGEITLGLPREAEIDLVLFEASVVSVLKASMARRPSYLSSEEAARLERGLTLYQGELLEGVDAEWLIYDRRRLHDAYLDGLWLLGGHLFDNGSYDRAGDCFQEILRWDPLREDVHRALMSVRHRQGRRGQAVDQFKLCSQSLRTELGVDAAHETRRLMARILETESSQGETPQGSQDLGDALLRVSAALHEAAGACAWLIDALSRMNPDPRADTLPLKSAPDRAKPARDY